MEPVLTEEQMSHYQSRLSYYLVRFRKRRNLTQDEAASIVGYSSPRYKAYEGRKADNSLIRAAEILTKFARLENLSMPAFAAFLENMPLVKTSQALLQWQADILRVLENIHPEVRQAWAEQMIESAAQPQNIEKALSLITMLLKEPNSLDAVLVLVSRASATAD